MILFLKFTFWKLNTSHLPHHMKFLLKPTVDTDSGAEKLKKHKLYKKNISREEI